MIVVRKKTIWCWIFAISLTILAIYFAYCIIEDIIHLYDALDALKESETSAKSLAGMLGITKSDIKKEITKQWLSLLFLIISTCSINMLLMHISPALERVSTNSEQLKSQSANKNPIIENKKSENSKQTSSNTKNAKTSTARKKKES